MLVFSLDYNVEPRHTNLREEIRMLRFYCTSDWFLLQVPFFYSEKLTFLYLTSGTLFFILAICSEPKTSVVYILASAPKSY